MGETTAQHTPLPWRAGVFEDPQWAVRSGSSEFALVCLTSQGNDEANAKFIARACNCHDDLLEALKEMDALVESLWDSVDWGSTFNLDISALNLVPPKAKDAIAKAEGESRC